MPDDEAGQWGAFVGEDEPAGEAPAGDEGEIPATPEEIEEVGFPPAPPPPAPPPPEEVPGELAPPVAPVDEGVIPPAPPPPTEPPTYDPRTPERARESGVPWMAVPPGVVVRIGAGDIPIITKAPLGYVPPKGYKISPELQKAWEAQKKAEAIPLPPPPIRRAPAEVARLVPGARVAEYQPGSTAYELGFRTREEYSRAQRYGLEYGPHPGQNVPEGSVVLTDIEGNPYLRAQDGDIRLNPVIEGFVRRGQYIQPAELTPEQERVKAAIC